MFVKPKSGALVRDPVTRQPLPKTGAEVPSDQYWMRRLADGDVVAGRPARLPTKED